MGYVVEINPFDPPSTPMERTTLKRFKHENAQVVLSAHVHIVVYMGDDERGELLQTNVPQTAITQILRRRRSLRREVP